MRARQVDAHDLSGRTTEAPPARTLGELCEVDAVPHRRVDGSGTRLHAVLGLARGRDGHDDRVDLRVVEECRVAQSAPGTDHLGQRARQPGETGGPALTCGQSAHHGLERLTQARWPRSR